MLIATYTRTALTVGFPRKVILKYLDFSHFLLVFPKPSNALVSGICYLRWGVGQLGLGNPQHKGSDSPDCGPQGEATCNVESDGSITVSEGEAQLGLSLPAQCGNVARNTQRPQREVEGWSRWHTGRALAVCKEWMPSADQQGLRLQPKTEEVLGWDVMRREDSGGSCPPKMGPNEPPENLFLFSPLPC